MPREILPVFRNADDPVAAEAFSETHYRKGEFKVEYPDYEEGTDFPPIPAYLSGIASAYLTSDNPTESPYRKAIITPTSGYTYAETADAFISNYERQVGAHHQARDIMIGAGFAGEVDRLIARASEKSRSAKLRTVAAFVTF